MDTHETNPRGRPPHVPSDATRSICETLAGYGVNHDKIASVLKITLPTMYKHYRPELDRGAASVEAMLINSLVRIAKGSDGTALKAIMFALQCRFGWSPYAPPREEPRPLGKKEELTLEAQQIPEEGGWGGLLN